ncbi:hypothetical protein IGI04_007661 [Brassica rapa subsp. trilocularis]|uniref:Glycolipid transfer protein domain-containing protein n=1 Tax=Brassica rapa subsp. trilocularis TaxID=1813537 RepID=A0ABQ7NKC4_BRACM|nr:hypothetical protein IGI04_007661 [Brassica rapa subsp. trilocularis]
MASKGIADAFKELAVLVNTPGLDVPVKNFSDACSRFFVVFKVLKTGMFPRFAEIDYVTKASNLTPTLELMVDRDIEANCVRKVGSHTRNLLRIKRSLEMMRVMCEVLLDTESDYSLRDATFTAYNQVFAPHHGWAIQQAVATGIGSLLPKTLLSGMFNETEETFKIHAQSYVTASASVTNYLDNLFLSKNLGIDW